jgi:hypothetical protein
MCTHPRVGGVAGRRNIKFGEEGTGRGVGEHHVPEEDTEEFFEFSRKGTVTWLTEDRFAKTKGRRASDLLQDSRGSQIGRKFLSISDYFQDCWGWRGREGGELEGWG